ncbi:hypothetical protein WN51_04964 [Melipona quadrifasciata]|uniref:Uncharacterized protein n=1 Tax=Melipona quadrifasciata TaxID=166423 RepID=A0A0N0U3M9_9HYME|nr:hypothetical protein WN51_04964 [Melipona quadrifasciata]
MQTSKINNEFATTCTERVGKNESGVGVDTTCSVASFASRGRQDRDEGDEDDEEDEDENGEDDELDKNRRLSKWKLHNLRPFFTKLSQFELSAIFDYHWHNFLIDVYTQCYYYSKVVYQFNTLLLQVTSLVLCQWRHPINRKKQNTTMALRSLCTSIVLLQYTNRSCIEPCDFDFDFGYQRSSASPLPLFFPHARKKFSSNSLRLGGLILSPPKGAIAQYQKTPLLLEVYPTPPHESRDPNQPIANFRCISAASVAFSSGFTIFCDGGAEVSLKKKKDLVLRFGTVVVSRFKRYNKIIKLNTKY